MTLFHYLLILGCGAFTFGFVLAFLEAVLWAVEGDKR